MPRKPKPITDQLRKAIMRAERSGVSRGQIARAAGISVTGLTKMLTTGTVPRLDTAERLADAVGCQLQLTSSG